MINDTNIYGNDWITDDNIECELMLRVYNCLITVILFQFLEVRELLARRHLLRYSSRYLLESYISENDD